jgi:2-polyprenyl-3-methyl-5-hydroxy-6-metoxy-1,4-benzoquinol methylase
MGEYLSVLDRLADHTVQRLNRVSGIDYLDRGCGTGLLRNILVSKGFEVPGIDVSLESLRLLQQRESRINDIQADLSSIHSGDSR